jgi:epoxyqueuosine reductase
MRYLTDRRAGLRDDPRTLLPAARSVIAVGKLYNTPQPYSTEFDDAALAWISRYAWSEDYHRVLRRGLRALEDLLREQCGAPFESRICVDTAPVLEREYARLAGLGWIGKNTCLINQPRGSWFVLGELLVSIEIEADAPPADRCGSCRRCIDACPTQAIVPLGGRYAIDSRLCISYLTIELRGAIAEERRAGVGGHVFGCDVCQDVCPWNRRAPTSDDAAFDPRLVAPPLERLAALSEAEFRELFGDTPVWRARYAGFLRNVAVAMGNRGLARFRPALEKLARSEDAMVAEHARWALGKLGDAG